MYDHMKSKGIKKIGLMTVSTAYGISGRTEMQRLAPLNGIQIVADETYGPKDSDLSAQYTKIRGTDAQAIVNWSIGPTQIIATMNWKNLGLKIPLYQSYGFGSKKNIELARGTAEGVILPVPRVVIADKLSDKDPQKATVTLYNQMFEGKFKQEVSVFGGHAWDALFQLIQALKDVGPDKEKIRNYLENLRGFIGQNGVFNRSAKDHEGLTKEAYVMVEVKNGDWEIVK
jgi:branched-chain amino acid transport system substrate-binding protein